MYPVPEGRPRGLAVSDEHLYVGVSKTRVGSLSRGTYGGHRGVCRIYRISKTDAETELVVDLSDERNEIYELMLI